MFNLRDFVKKGLIDAVGKMADYQVILNNAQHPSAEAEINDDI